MAYVSMHTPLGPLTLFADDRTIVALEWGWSPANGASPLLDEARAQLEAYFDGALTRFTLPLAAAATPFQQRVREAMLRIPYGAVSTYAALAREVDSAPRAIGQACARNPLPIIVPCHRVLAAGGDLGGYSGGEGTAAKRALLRLEGYAGLDTITNRATHGSAVRR